MTTSATDVLAGIDALITQQLDAGEPIGGYDYDDPDFPKCLWPGCWEDWHGLKITRRMHEMRWRGALDDDYRYRDDNSEVICPGGDFVGPPAPRRASLHAGESPWTVREWALPAVEVQFPRPLLSMTPLFEGFTASLREAMARVTDWPAPFGSWQTPELFTLRRREMPPNPLLPEQSPIDDTPVDPDPIIDRAMQTSPLPPSLLDPDTEYSNGIVWVDNGHGFGALATQKHQAGPFALSVSARPNTNKPRAPRQGRPTLARRDDSGRAYHSISVRWPDSSWRWEVSVGAPSVLHVTVATPPARREIVLTPTYRCERPSRIDQPRPWVRERGFDRRGQRKRARQ
ncbi:hypothetical protein [Nocardia otitidiscaviarum]|uniref:hypothetical protein n=1 Tax=Nocardia otitidiscaviarum TaxID=1823 RepID=UPI0004A73F75|nr:hypothetical protein [Nocardia otitidiscaviarum]